jgi:KEOPS complex subunit Pcc1
MSESAKATIRLELDSEKQIDTLLAALTPEAKAPPTHRSKVNLQKNGCSLTLAVEAEDTVALRATLNAYLRWINSMLSVLDVVGKV